VREEEEEKEDHGTSSHLHMPSANLLSPSKARRKKKEGRRAPTPYLFLTYSGRSFSPRQFVTLQADAD